MVVGARQVFDFSDKLPGFSEKKELCFNFNFVYLVSIVKLQNN